MNAKQKKETKTRLKNYEIRLQALRSVPGPIDTKVYEIEKYLQSEVNTMREQLRKAAN